MKTSVGAFFFIGGGPDFGSGLMLLESLEFRVMFSVGVSLDSLAAGVETAEICIETGVFSAGVERDVEHLSKLVGGGLLRDIVLVSLAVTGGVDVAFADGTGSLSAKSLFSLSSKVSPFAALGSLGTASR